MTVHPKFEGFINGILMSSQVARALGISLQSMAVDHIVLRMPFRRIDRSCGRRVTFDWTTDLDLQNVHRNTAARV